jgi:hypothetical protein
LRTENCDIVNGFGYPLSTRDSLYVELKQTEYIFNKQNVLVPNSWTLYQQAQIINKNNFIIDFNGKFNQTNLYKNIHRKPTSYISNSATSIASIKLKYQQDKSWNSHDIETSAKFTLYDSKCRVCRNSATTLKEVRNTLEKVGIRILYLNMKRSVKKYFILSII